MAIDLIAKDIADLPDKSIPIREKWKEVKAVSNPRRLRQFDAATKATLDQEIAPLMQWANIAGHEEAHKFDRLITQMQTALIKGSSRFDDLKDELVNQVSSLPINLSQVKVKLPIIERGEAAEFWDQRHRRELEELRNELRGIMQFRLTAGPWPCCRPRCIDIEEDESWSNASGTRSSSPVWTWLRTATGSRRCLQDLFDTNETLQKIKAGEPVSEADLDALCSLVLTLDSSLDLHDLTDYFPETAGHLDQAIRSIIGMDGQAVHERFTQFVQEHPHLVSHQIKFLDLLQNHIAKYGSIEARRPLRAAVHHAPHRQSRRPVPPTRTRLDEHARRSSPTYTPAAHRQPGDNHLT